MEIMDKLRVEIEGKLWVEVNGKKKLSSNLKKNTTNFLKNLEEIESAFFTNKQKPSQARTYEI